MEECDRLPTPPASPRDETDGRDREHQQAGGERGSEEGGWREGREKERQKEG